MLKRFYNSLTWDVKSMPVLVLAIIASGFLFGCGESPEEAQIRLQEKQIEAQVEIARINAEAQMEIADDYSEAGIDQNGNYNQGGNMGSSAPVIVNGGGSGMGDVATGMILGSMLSNSGSSGGYDDDYDRSRPKTVINKTVVNKTVVVDKNGKTIKQDPKKQIVPKKPESKNTKLNFSKNKNTKQVNNKKTAPSKKKKVKETYYVNDRVPYQQCRTVNKKRKCVTKYKNKRVKKTRWVWK